MLSAAHWTAALPADACTEAVEWARTQPDYATAWAVCERGDWLLWLIGRLSGPPDSESRRRLVGAAADCEALALPIFEARYPGDTRPRVAIETARRYARGEATAEECGTAAAYAAYAYAAYAYAADAAAAAAAADAADAADAAYATYRSGRARVLRECADIVRQHYPEAPTLPPR